MQDGEAIRADEAGEWLRENLKDKPEPKVTLSIEGDGVSPAAYRRVLEILFRPRADGAAL
jgi:hypothetical protein